MGKNAKKIFFCLAIIVLFTIGFYIRFKDLGKNNFQNDEYFHLNTAYGYLKTGDYAYWNFFANKADGFYHRAVPYTWQVAQTFKFLGVSEFSGRLPSLAWGMLFLFLGTLFAYKYYKNYFFIIILFFLLSFDDYMIETARICRMYSMFMVLALITVYLTYLGLESKKKAKYVYLFLSLLFLLFTYSVHQAGAVLAVGFAFYIIINALIKLWQKDFSWNIYYVFSLAFILITSLVLLYNFFVNPIQPLEQFISFRENPHFNYLWLAFSQWKFPLLGAGLFILSYAFISYKDKFKFFILSVNSGVLLFFIFFAARYSAQRYISFIMIFIFSQAVYSVFYLYKKITEKTKINKYFLLAVIVLFFTLNTVSFLFINKEKQLDYKSVYNYVVQQKKQNEVLITMDPRSYYLSSRDIKVINMPKYEKLSLKEIQDMMAENPESWIVYAEKKEHHLRPKVVEYINSKCRRIIETKEKMFKVFYCSNQI